MHELPPDNHSTRPRSPRARAARRAIGRALLIALAALAARSAWATPVFGKDFEVQCSTPLYSEPFTAVDARAPHSPWQIAGDVARADLSIGAAQLPPFLLGDSPARMVTPEATSDVGVHFSFRLESDATWGVAFYVRESGGNLDQSCRSGTATRSSSNGNSEEFRDRPVERGGVHLLVADATQPCINGVAPSRSTPGAWRPARPRSVCTRVSTTSISSR